MTRLLVLAAALCAGGCTNASFRDDALVRADAYPVAERAAPTGVAPAFDGSLAGYLAHAMRQSPGLEALFAEWRASIYAISRRQRWPEPRIGYGYFVRSVETRVGPQRHRFSVQQMLPWPRALDAATDGAVAEARAAEQRLEAEVLALRERIAALYWRIWLHDRSHEILAEQKQLLAALSEAVRTRVELGRASLAELAQIDLDVSRLQDALETHMSQAAALRARLSALLSVSPRAPLPVTGEPPPAALPARDEPALIAAARDNPGASAMVAMAEARTEQARAADAEGLPDVTLGLDYIETGAAAMPGVADSGKDPVIVSIGMSVPLWRGSYADEARRARAEARAFRARGEAAADELAAALVANLHEVRDAARRVERLQTTLLPQAQSVYDALVSAYQTGDAPLASLLIAERDVLALRLELTDARAAHASAWAAMERAVGASVPAREAAP